MHRNGLKHVIATIQLYLSLLSLYLDLSFRITIELFMLCLGYLKIIQLCKRDKSYRCFACGPLSNPGQGDA